MQRRTSIFATLSCLGLAHGLTVQESWAQEAGGGAALSSDGLTADGGGDGGDLGGGAELGDHPFELGLFAGVMLMSGRQDTAVASPRADAPELDGVAFEGGLRLGVYPIEYLGIEGEGALILTGNSADVSALLGTARGHLVGQLPLGIWAPFLVVGGGVIGAECPPGGCDGNTSGREVDGSFHFGLGAKLALAEHFHARLDLRDTIAAGDHLPEALLGLAFTFGGGSSEEPPPPAPLDSDGDGLSDDQDKCPTEAATTPDGCPVKDRDGDGKPDDVDQCPDVASELENGCPDPDTDKDGVPAEQDKCPDVAGVAPDGCPDPDADKDGVPVPDDKCEDKPETINGFEDKDGCPDEVPESVKKFTGVIQGIEFNLGQATIRPVSFPVLDGTVAVLQEHPSLRLRISGHTDNTGKPERNQELSKQRAEAVAGYFVSKGIAADRLETVGHGADQPVEDNKTAAGRQKNRRIEFAVIQ